MAHRKEPIDSNGFPIENIAVPRQHAVEDKSKAKKKEEAFQDTTAKDIKRYADLMGVGGANDKVTKKFKIWCRVLNKFLFKQSGEENPGKRALGEMPEFELTPIVKPRTGNLRKLVLAGGGPQPKSMVLGQIMDQLLGAMAKERSHEHTSISGQYDESC